MVADRKSRPPCRHADGEGAAAGANRDARREGLQGPGGVNPPGALYCAHCDAWREKSDCTRSRKWDIGSGHTVQYLRCSRCNSDIGSERT